jgi:hypothetical protein
MIRTPLPVIICNRKQGHYSNRRICEMTLNMILYNPETSNYLSVVFLLLKCLHTLVYRITLETDTHKQVKVVYYYIEKGN